MKKSKIIIAILVIILFGVATAGFTYLTMEIYKPESGIESQIKEDGAKKKGYIAYGDETADTAIVLYPDEKVNYMAYGPLAKLISENSDCICIVPEIITGFANLDYKAAEDVMEEYPDVSVWYIGGHGLGGTAAAKYADKTGSFEGVALIASYAEVDISDMKVLSIIGSCDAVVDSATYDQYKNNLPDDLEQLTILGANHAQFGSYGGQHINDSEAEMSQQEQQEKTAAAIADFIAG